MSTATTVSPIQREPQLLGQTVGVIGGSAGIGLETARRARAGWAKLILTGPRRQIGPCALTEVFVFHSGGTTWRGR